LAYSIDTPNLKIVALSVPEIFKEFEIQKMGHRQRIPKNLL